MRRFFLFLFFLGTALTAAWAQKWALIESNSEYNRYLRLDVVPVSPRNETRFCFIYKPDCAVAEKAKYKYSALPSYDLTTNFFNDSFDHYACRSYNVYDEEGNLLSKNFHGFLTYDTVYAGGKLRQWALWGALLKMHGPMACLCASETKWTSQDAQWVKFDEDETTVRYVRVDYFNAEDSLVMFRVDYKPKWAKEVQKQMEFSETPESRVFVHRMCDGGLKLKVLAETWYFKKSSTQVWVYPWASEVDLTGVYLRYAEWTDLLFSKGKDAVVSKSNSLFGHK